MYTENVKLPPGTNPPETPEQYEAFLNIPGVKEAEARSMWNHSPVPAAAISRNGRFLRVNDAFCRMLGYSPLELVQLEFSRITHERHRRIDADEAQALVEGRRDNYSLANVLITNLGESVQVEMTVWAFRINGKFMHFLVKAPELRMPLDRTQVVYDANGKPILVPNQSLEGMVVDFIRRHKKTTGSIVALLTSILTAVVWYVNDYHSMSAKEQYNDRRIQELEHDLDLQRLRRSRMAKGDGP